MRDVGLELHRILIDQSNRPGVIMCVGRNDTGKSTFVKEALQMFSDTGKPYLHIDLDMGQSTIGPPATLGLRTSEGTQFLYFAGNLSPFGVMREIRKGVSRFRRIIEDHPGRQTIVDTTGLIKGDFGWAVRKMQIVVLGVDFIIFFDRRRDTASIRRHVTELSIPHVTVCPGPLVRRKSAAERSSYRRFLFSAYFRKARAIGLATGRRRMMHMISREEPGQLLGLLNKDDFLISLGLFLGRAEGRIIVRTPPAPMRQIRSVVFGRYILPPDLLAHMVRKP